MKMNLGVQVAENFWSGEFQCKCGCGYGLDPDDLDPNLVAGVQQIRGLLGFPLYIVRWDQEHNCWYPAGSGCRCREHNGRTKNSSPTSKHLEGKAADLWGPPVQEIYHAAIQVPVFQNGGIGFYETRHFVHVDTRAGSARWSG